MTRRVPRKLKRTGKFWIFCEGSTEKRYFNNLRIIERVKIHLVPKEAGVSRADQILQKAMSFHENDFMIDGDTYDHKRDRIACVFDKDDNNTDDVFKWIRKTKIDSLILGYSNPSFEYWFLCHFGFYSSSSLDQKEVYRLVKEKMGLDPKKDHKLYERTKMNLDKAIKNSKKIKIIHEKNGIEILSRNSTPVTLVYYLIEIIKNYQ